MHSLVTNTYLRSPYLLPPGPPEALSLVSQSHTQETSEILDRSGPFRMSEVCSTLRTAAKATYLVALFLHVVIDRLFFLH
jgi:hypothetical protein